MNWAGRHVVLGVSGGIASYKSCILARRLVESGATVDVVLTRSAGEFIRPATFEALTGRPVLASLWEPGHALQHVRLGHDADIVVVAPATAHLIARVAQGLADDFLTTMLLASTAPVLLAPAMNDEMYASPVTVQNLEHLQGLGMRVVGPETGALAEGPSERPGRMSEPDTILAHAARLLRSRAPMAGRLVVVTAGPTREPLDPVRVVTNRSSGLMGFSIAAAAWQRGAEVVLISGPSALAAPAGVRMVRVETTAEMAAAVGDALPSADVLVMAAAPADYRTADPAATKRPRSEGALAIALQPTDDILLQTRDRRRSGALIVGFALETGDAVSKAAAKLERKGLDLIVVNDALEPGAGFEVATNRVTILDRSGERIEVPLASKAEVAEAIIDAIEARISG